MSPAQRLRRLVLAAGCAALAPGAALAAPAQEEIERVPEAVAEPQRVPAPAAQPQRLPAPKPAASPAVPAKPQPPKAAARGLLLGRLMPWNGPLRLERARSEATIAVPVSVRTAVEGAKLRLYGTHSALLKPQRSMLTVSFNERIVAQRPLNGGSPHFALEIPLPAELFRSEFNRLKFQVIQSDQAMGAQDPFAPDLWTQIDTERSYVLLTEKPRALAPTLMDLPELFSPKAFAPQTVALLPASGTFMDESALRAGAAIAQGLALRYQFTPLALEARRPLKSAAPVTDWRAPAPLMKPDGLGGKDAVLFGTLDEVSAFVNGEIAGAITGPFLGVYPRGEDPSKLLVVVSGRDTDELLKAAQAFALLDSPFPRAAQAVVRAIDLPDWPEDAVPGAVSPGKTYTFKQLGFKTRTLSGFDRAEGELKLRLPPDLYATPSAVLRLNLGMALGGGLAPGSVLNVLVNREFAQEIPVDGERSRMLTDLHLELPLTLFKAGDNTLTLATRFSPARGSGLEGMPLTIFGESTLEVPNAPRFAGMPNLALLAESGFPYARRPDGEGTLFWLGGTDEQTLGAAWTFAARMAQATGLPLTRARWTYDAAEPGEDLVFLGARAALPEAARRALGTRLTPGGASLPGFDASRAPQAREPVRFEVGATPATWLTLAQAESPWAAGRTLTAVAAETPTQLSRGVSRFVRPEAWGGLQGEATYFEPATGKLAWRPADESYGVGALPPREALARFGTRLPGGLVGIAGLLLAIVAFGGAALLRRRGKDTHGVDEPVRLF